MKCDKYYNLLSLFVNIYWNILKSEWVSSFLTAHQHIIGYSVPQRKIWFKQMSIRLLFMFLVSLDISDVQHFLF